MKLNAEMKAIAEFFDGMGNIYFVGGCVRDLIMGNMPNDYDISTAKTPDEVSAFIKSKGRRVYNIGKKFGTVGVKINNTLVEVTTFRGETYSFKDRKPEVVWGNNINQDLDRRDFTINAIALRQDGKLIDPHKGVNDIENGIIKCVGNSRLRFQEDPLRILRGIRFCAKYRFNFEKRTADRIESCRWELLRISKERIIEEINKIFLSSGDNIMIALSMLWSNKIFQVILPELQLQYWYDQNSPHHSWTLDLHTSIVVALVRGWHSDPRYLWAALLHDIAKPFTRELHKSGERCNYINHELLGAEIADKFCRFYKFSNEDREFIVDSIKNHLNDDCWLREYDNRSKM